MKKSLKIAILALLAVVNFALVACVSSNGQAANALGAGSNFASSDSTSNGQTVGTASKTEGSASNDTMVDAVSMESKTDSFKLLEAAYGAEDKFVYTATVSFEGGVASGLAFGAEDGSHYWVFNVDREANLVKLLYFTVTDGKTSAVELLTDYFIGNDKMTESEKRLVNPKVAALDKVQLKVVITPEEDAVYAEFYADNIRRFGIDNTIDLNTFEDASYDGGNIGFNCFNSKVNFDDIYYGKSDISY